MKTHYRVLTIILVLSLVVIPGYAAMESAGSGVTGDLTLADFHKMYGGQKPIVAQSAYERYQYRLNHPAPKVTLGVSRMRSEATLADFQKAYADQKPIVAQSEYERHQYRQKYPVKVTSGADRNSTPLLKSWLVKR